MLVQTLRQKVIPGCRKSSASHCGKNVFCSSDNFRYKRALKFQRSHQFLKSSNNEEFSHCLVNRRCSECEIFRFSLNFKIAPQVSAQGGEGSGEHHHGPIPKGCEDPPKDAPKLSQCCTGFPKFYSKDVMKNNCSATCGDVKGPSGFCCKSDCMLNTFGVLTNGKFDSDKAKAAIATLTANNTAWTSDVSFFFVNIIQNLSF